MEYRLPSSPTRAVSRRLPWRQTRSIRFSRPTKVLTEVAAEEGRARSWARPLTLIPGFRNGRPRWWNQRSEEIVVGYAFLAPDLIGLVVFIAIPILGAAWISLTDWQGLSD